MGFAKVQWIVLPALCGLAMGCSDSSDGGEPPLGRYEALLDRGAEIGAEIEAEVYTDPASLPTSGEATYRGVIGLDTNGLIQDGVADNFDLQGDLAMIVDFGDDTDPISGQATDFISSAEQEYPGTLTISNSGLYRDADVMTEYTYDFSLDGALEDPDGDSVGIAAGVGGDFSGDHVEEAEHAFGDIMGEACRATTCRAVDGAFVAQHD